MIPILLSTPISLSHQGYLRITYVETEVTHSTPKYRKGDVAIRGERTCPETVEIDVCKILHTVHDP